MDRATALGVFRRAYKTCIGYRQHMLVLFLFWLMVFATISPVGVAAAAAISTPTPQSVSAKANLHATSTSPSIGKINDSSPGAPQLLSARSSAAANARPGQASGSASFLDTVLGSKLSSSPAMMPATSAWQSTEPHELTSARTANTSLYLNKDGTVTKTQYLSPHFYQNNGAWDVIDTGLKADTNAADSGNIFGKALGIIESWLSSPTAYKTKANDWEARFAKSNFAGGMVRVRQGKSRIGFSPVDANTVAPTITTDAAGMHMLIQSQTVPIRSALTTITCLPALMQHLRLL